MEYNVCIELVQADGTCWSFLDTANFAYKCCCFSFIICFPFWYCCKRNATTKGFYFFLRCFIWALGSLKMKVWFILICMIMYYIFFICSISSSSSSSRTSTSSSTSCGNCSHHRIVAIVVVVIVVVRGVI